MFQEGEGGKDVEEGGGEQDHRHLSHGPLRSCEITRCEDEFFKQGCLHLNVCAIILVITTSTSQPGGQRACDGEGGGEWQQGSRHQCLVH